MKLLRTIGRYLLRNLMEINQIGNTLTGGSMDETISSRIGKAQVRRGGTWPWWHPINVIRVPFEMVDPDHFVKAIENDEGRPLLRPISAEVAAMFLIVSVVIGALSIFGTF